MEFLPDHVLFKIIKKLTFPELLKSRLINKRFKFFVDQVLKKIKIKDISIGIFNCYALLNTGDIINWGLDVYYDSKMPPFTKKIKKIVGGDYHSLVLFEDNSIFWSGLYQRIPPFDQPIIDLAVGLFHSLALTKEGQIIGWGTTNYHQLEFPLFNYTKISAGDYHSLALTIDNKVVEWGCFGLSVIPFDKKVIQISAGQSHSLILLKDGTVVGLRCEVPTFYSKVVQISAGKASSLALLENGELIERSEGFTKIILKDVKIKKILTKSYHSLILFETGKIYNWGQLSMDPINFFK